MGQSHTARATYNNINVTFATTIDSLDAARTTLTPNTFPNVCTNVTMGDYTDLTKDEKRDKLQLDADQIRMLDSITCKYFLLH
jgi:hypothetical protein